MGIAKDLVIALGNKIKEVHISGRSEIRPHLPLDLAPNQKELSNFLKKYCRNLPWISEGGPTKLSELKPTLDYLKALHKS